MREISVSRLFSCEATISQIRSRRHWRNPPLMNICLHPASGELAAVAAQKPQRWGNKCRSDRQTGRDVNLRIYPNVFVSVPGRERERERLMSGGAAGRGEKWTGLSMRSCKDGDLLASCARACARRQAGAHMRPHLQASRWISECLVAEQTKW